MLHWRPPAESDHAGPLHQDEEGSAGRGGGTPKRASFFGKKAAKVAAPEPAPAPKKASFFSKKAVTAPTAAPAKGTKASVKTLDKAQEYK